MQREYCELVRSVVFSGDRQQAVEAGVFALGMGEPSGEYHAAAY